jgi:hypothetical protein
MSTVIRLGATENVVLIPVFSTVLVIRPAGRTGKHLKVVSRLSMGLARVVEERLTGNL